MLQRNATCIDARMARILLFITKTVSSSAILEFKTRSGFSVQSRTENSAIQKYICI